MSGTNEVRTVSSTGGAKGSKSERFDLIPVEPLTWLARQYAIGAAKYGDPYNYRKGYPWSLSYAALQRHANAFWRGEDWDDETGQPHLAAVAWHAFALLTFVDEHPEFDDRYVPARYDDEPTFDEVMAKYENKPYTETELAGLREKLKGQ